MCGSTFERVVVPNRQQTATFRHQTTIDLWVSLPNVTQLLMDAAEVYSQRFSYLRIRGVGVRNERAGHAVLAGRKCPQQIAKSALPSPLIASIHVPCRVICSTHPVALPLDRFAHSSVHIKAATEAAASRLTNRRGTLNGRVAILVRLVVACLYVGRV